MMWMKQLFIAFGIMLALSLIPSVFSAIVFDDIDEVYNLGDVISPKISILHSEDFDGLAKAKLECNSYSLEYYTVLFDIERGQQRNVELTPLPVRREMRGNCVILFGLYDFNEKRVKSEYSSSFKVTDSLAFSIDSIVGKYMPGDYLLISGLVKDSNSNLVPGKLVFKFGSDVLTFDIDGRFKFNYSIPSKTKAGRNVVSLDFYDDKGNKADDVLVFDVLQKPSSIRIRLSPYEIYPKNDLIVTAFLLDQTDSLIFNIKMNLLIYSGLDDTMIVDKQIPPGDFNVSINNSINAGNYNVLVYYDDIRSYLDFQVMPYINITAYLNGTEIVFSNKGNIDHDGIINLLLSSEQAEFLLEHELLLAPGELKSVDISRMTDKGEYDISFNDEVLGSAYLDGKPGIFGITGMAMVDIGSKPNFWISFFILLGIIGLIVFSRKKIFKANDDDVLKDIKHNSENIYPADSKHLNDEEQK